MKRENKLGIMIKLLRSLISMTRTIRVCNSICSCGVAVWVIQGLIASRAAMNVGFIDPDIRMSYIPNEYWIIGTTP